MSISLVINGTTYLYPEQGDLSWGPDATNWAQGVTLGMLQKAGGSFTLTAEVDFGASFGLKTLYYKSRTSNPASSGEVRLARADTVTFRNEANDADIELGVDSSNRLIFNSVIVRTGLIVNADVDAAAAIVYSKLALTGGIVNADISASAVIAYNKLAALTVSRALVSDGSGVVSVATTTSTEIGYVNGVTSAIQTQLNAKLDDTGSSTDNAVVRWDGTAGAAVQNSGVTVSDTDVVAGVTQLNVDNLRLDGNTIISTDTNGAINLTPDGTGRTSITRTTLVGTTANHVLINDGSGNVSSEATLAITRGGTGQATVTAAFDALAPTTTKGDLIVHNGTNNIRVAVGTNGYFLSASSGATSGVAWALGASIVAEDSQVILSQRVFN
jgi:hypothetical protein